MVLRFEKNERAFTGLEAAIVLIAFVTVAAVFSYIMLGAGFFATQKSKQVVHTGVSEASSSLELDGQYIYLTANQTGSNGDVKMIDFYVTLTAGKMKVDLNKVTLAYKDKDDYVQIPFTKFILVNSSGLPCGGDNLAANYSNYYAVFSFDSSNNPKVTFYNSSDSSKNCSFDLVVNYEMTNDNDHWKITPNNDGFLPFWYYKPIIAEDPKNLVKSGEKFQIFVQTLIMVASMNSSDKFYFDNTKSYYLVELDSSSYNILKLTELNSTSYKVGQIKNLPGTNEDLTIELKPSVGAPLIINKETPPSLKSTSYV